MTTTRETADHIGEANEKVADHTQCEDCGGTNCQIPEPYQMDDECEDDDQ
ncbi:hypothetical protein [Brevundimonas sp. CEF1]